MPNNKLPNGAQNSPENALNGYENDEASEYDEMYDYSSDELQDGSESRSRGQAILERTDELLNGRTQLDYKIYGLSRKKKIIAFAGTCLALAAIFILFLYIAL